MKNIKQIEKRIRDSCLGIKRLSDLEFKELVNTKVFDKLLLSILNPRYSKRSKNLQEYFLRNKNRLSFLALLRYVIGENYVFSGKVGKNSAYVSPFHYQWLDNGVIFTQGKDKWKGLIGFYDNEKNLYFARSKKNFKGGDKIDLKKDLFFDFFYQKIRGMDQINPVDKKEILDKVEKIRNENKPSKVKTLILKFGKWLDGKTERIWYQTVRAYFDSLNK